MKAPTYLPRRALLAAALIAFLPACSLVQDDSGQNESRAAANARLGNLEKLEGTIRDDMIALESGQQSATFEPGGQGSDPWGFAASRAEQKAKAEKPAEAASDSSDSAMDQALTGSASGSGNIGSTANGGLSEGRIAE